MRSSHSQMLRAIPDLKNPAYCLVDFFLLKPFTDIGFNLPKLWWTRLLYSIRFQHPCFDKFRIRAASWCVLVMPGSRYFIMPGVRPWLFFVPCLLRRLQILKLVETNSRQIPTEAPANIKLPFHVSQQFRTTVVSRMLVACTCDGLSLW